MTHQSFTNGVADELIAESKRLREELLRTAARLQGFADQLAQEVADLKEEQDDEQPDQSPRA